MKLLFRKVLSAVFLCVPATPVTSRNAAVRRPERRRFSAASTCQHSARLALLCTLTCFGLFANASTICLVNNQLHECTAMVGLPATFEYTAYSGWRHPISSVSSGQSDRAPGELIALGESYLQGAASNLLATDVVQLSGERFCTTPARAANRLPDSENYIAITPTSEFVRYGYKFSPFSTAPGDNPTASCVSNSGGTSGTVLVSRTVTNCPDGFTLQGNQALDERCVRPLLPESGTCTIWASKHFPKPTTLAPVRILCHSSVCTAPALRSTLETA
jgi:hypothetical protein